MKRDAVAQTGRSGCRAWVGALISVVLIGAGCTGDRIPSSARVREGAGAETLASGRERPLSVSPQPGAASDVNGEHGLQHPPEQDMIGEGHGERARAAAENPIASGEGPLAGPDWEALSTWEEAREWWGEHAPLLRAVQFPGADGPTENLFWSDDTELGGDRFLMAVYSYDKADPSTNSQWEILDTHGLILRFRHVRPGNTPAYAHPFWTKKVVQVRGHPAKLFEARRSEGSNVDWRVVYWETPSEEQQGALVQYSIDVSPERYSEEQTIEFINRLHLVE